MPQRVLCRCNLGYVWTLRVKGHTLQLAFPFIPAQVLATQMLMLDEVPAHAVVGGGHIAGGAPRRGHLQLRRAAAASHRAPQLNPNESPP